MARAEKRLLPLLTILLRCLGPQCVVLLTPCIHCHASVVDCAHIVCVKHKGSGGGGRPRGAASELCQQEGQDKW